MLAFSLRRAVYSVPVLLVASFLVFALGALSADPLAPLRARNPPASQQVIDAETVRLHLDQPLLARYFGWLGGVLHGDFGPSVVSTADIGADLAGRFWVTIRLVALAMLVALVLAVAIGVLTAVRQYTGVDYAATFVGFLFLAMPSFWFAILLKQAGIAINVSVGQQVLFTVGQASVPPPADPGARILDTLGHMILPTISLALISYAAWSRFVRASMLEVMNSDYVRLARAKGLSRRKVLIKHALRTALIPLTTVTALDIASILGGAVVTETVFQWKGMGDYLFTSIRTNDVYATASWLLVSATIVIVGNLIADLLYGVLDPRIRRG